MKEFNLWGVSLCLKPFCLSHGVDIATLLSHSAGCETCCMCTLDTGVTFAVAACKRFQSTDLKALIDQPFLVQGAEDPPHTLHKAGVQSLVIILKVNPPAYAFHCLLPLFGVPALKVP